MSDEGCLRRKNLGSQLDSCKRNNMKLRNRLKSTQQQLSDTEKALEKEKDKVAVAVADNIKLESALEWLRESEPELSQEQIAVINEALTQLKDD